MSRALRGVMEFLRRATPVLNTDEPTDRQLLRRFADEADEEAFATLVRRHAPMVQAVCQRIVGNGADADDAFQATFIVLARKASAAGWQESIAGWLYEVAYRVASRQKTAAACRRAHERQALAMASPDATDHLGQDELRSLLDRELARLPEKYRAPLVLCYLEGKTNEEAARLLGWTKGTVSGRLARARELLRGRLGRQGLGLSGAAVATALGDHAAPAALSPMLLDTTIHAALGAAKSALATGAVATLAEGVIATMFWNHVRTLAVRAIVGVAILAGIGTVSYPVISATVAKRQVVNARDIAEKRDAEAAEAIKALIPEAASLPAKEWRKLDEVFAPPPTPDQFKNQPLSLVLFCVFSGPLKNEAARKEFRVLDDVIAAHSLRVTPLKSEDKGYGTLLQPEFITDVTAMVQGNEATGVVSFRADKVYEGRVEYTARRTKAGGWRVEEFRMPAHKFRVTLQEDGNWKYFELAAADPKAKDTKLKPPEAMGSSVIWLRKHNGFGPVGKVFSVFTVEKDGSFNFDGRTGKLSKEAVADLIEQCAKADAGRGAEDDRNAAAAARATPVEVWWLDAKKEYHTKLFIKPDRNPDCQKLLNTIAALAAKLQPPEGMGTRVIWLTKRGGLGARGFKVVSEFAVEKDFSFQFDGKSGKLPKEAVDTLIEQCAKADIGPAAEDAGTVDVWWKDAKNDYHNKLFTMPGGAPDCVKLLQAIADLAAKHADKPALNVKDAKTGITVDLLADQRTLIAKDAEGKELWKKDVIVAAGAPAVGQLVVRHLSVKDTNVIAVYGKSSFAAFDLKTGKYTNLGSD
jgi:RNA polymerase sigma factor (sigma-70 family)